MQTTTERTVREIAVEIPASVGVFESLGIDYCCGGGNSLTDACARAGVDADRVMVMIDQAARRSETGAQEDWASRSLSDLVAHIAGKHHGFVRAEVPRIQSLSRKVASKHGPSHPELFEIEQLFSAIAQELSTHMMKEEHILFPYIERLEQSSARTPACFGSVRFPIANMMAEHEDAGALLEQIRERTSNFAAPSNACTSYRALYAGLELFERDLHQHVHLENNILFPRAIALEESL